MKTLEQLIAAHGIDASRALRNMRQRRAYAARQDRPKVFATGDIPAPFMYTRRDGSRPTHDDLRADQALLRFAGMPNKSPVATADYIAAWCRLNHLTVGE